jgi:hypothetical protein
VRVLARLELGLEVVPRTGLGAPEVLLNIGAENDDRDAVVKFQRLGADLAARPERDALRFGPKLLLDDGAQRLNVGCCQPLGSFDFLAPQPPTSRGTREKPLVGVKNLATPLAQRAVWFKGTNV